MATQAMALALAEPARATQLATAALGDESIRPTDRVKALWALGLGLRELDDLDESASALRQAIAAARHGGNASLASQITSSLAWVVARMGDSEEALRLTDQAAVHLEGGPAARNEMQRGLVLQRLGLHRRALASYATALAGLEEAGDHLAAARLRLNRSVLHVYSGALTPAVEDLEAAYNIAVREGQMLLEAACAHNLGFTHGRRGDIPRALSWFDTAQSIFADLGSRRRDAALRADRAETYAGVGLLGDALADAAAAVTDLRSEDEPPALADALLLLARIADLAGQHARATACAAEARQLFAEQGRETWELQAQHLETIATLRDSGEAQHLDGVLDLSSRLHDQGWESEARRTRIEAARLSFDRGHTEAAIRILEPLEDLPPASPLDRVAHSEAMYMLGTARGNVSEARRALHRGLDILDRHRAGMGSAEIRAGMATHGVRLVGAAVDQALEVRSPWRVLQAVDTWRARSLDFPPALPPDDPDLAAALAELRGIDSELREAKESGEETSDLLARGRRLEEKVRRKTRQVEANDQEAVSGLRRTELNEMLDGRGLVSYFARGGSIHAVWYDGGRWNVTELGSREEIADDVAAMVFALNRLAAAHGSGASLAAAALSLEDVAAKLSQVLVEPLRLPDRPVVVVPTGALHRLPWNALPALTGRAVSVSPSVRLWMRAARVDRDPGGRAALVAGPDLAGARSEVERLARLYEKSQRLTGRNARTERALSILDGAAVAHLAAHGTFRADNPLFSSVRMADGPLTVYDLERLRSVPRVVVMPSCDSAVSQVGAGDELLGLAAAVLRMGASSLIASVVPISDVATRPLMIALHRRIKDGTPPAAALAETLAAGGSDSPQEKAARAGFVALGT